MKWTNCKRLKLFTEFNNYIVIYLFKVRGKQEIDVEIKRIYEEYLEVIFNDGKEKELKEDEE